MARMVEKHMRGFFFFRKLSGKICLVDLGIGGSYLDKSLRNRMGIYGPGSPGLGQGPVTVFCEDVIEL